MYIMRLTSQCPGLRVPPWSSLSLVLLPFFSFVIVFFPLLFLIQLQLLPTLTLSPPYFSLFITPVSLFFTFTDLEIIESIIFFPLEITLLH